MTLQTNLYLIITLFGSASYLVGLWRMLTNQYSPSTFSRVVWVLLAINSFAGVILSHSSSTSILLGAILLIGNIAICIASLWKGSKEIGQLEYICIALLIISAFVWIFFKAPLVNLALSLFGHFVGACPTYKKVLYNPESEDLACWLLFFIASILSIFACNFVSLADIMLPLYYTLFDGSIVLLILRKKIAFIFLKIAD
ncbi:MAG TPA: hypothetical protein VLH77_04275 [Gammaproteobacteria bacterium]|nr:hypothetical protein [Gammaproteobacteria bacterium]